MESNNTDAIWVELHSFLDDCSSLVTNRYCCYMQCNYRTCQIFDYEYRGEGLCFVNFHACKKTEVTNF